MKVDRLDDWTFLGIFIYLLGGVNDFSKMFHSQGPNDWSGQIAFLVSGLVAVLIIRRVVLWMIRIKELEKEATMWQERYESLDERISKEKEDQ